MIKFSKAAITFVLMASVISCGNDDDSAVSTKLEFDDLNEALVEHTDLSMLGEAKAIVNDTEINRAFAADFSGGHTIFAPTNSAWEAYLKDHGFDAMEDIPKETLKMLLKYNWVSEAYYVKDFSTAYIHETTGTVNYKDLGNANYFEGNWEGGDQPLEIFVNTNSGVLLNGISTIVQGDIFATNTKFGTNNSFIMHKVDKVIELPTVETMIKADPDLSTFETLIGKSSKVGKIFSEIKSQNPFTLYVPNNAGFNEAYDEFSVTTLDGLLTETSDVETFAKNHVEINTSKDDLDFPSVVTQTFYSLNMNMDTLAFSRNSTSNKVDITDEKGRVVNVIVPKDKDGVVNGYNINTMNGSIYKISNILIN